ncbi:hypothetical protein B0H14DRAFT_3491438 [Mycena olivaceomarginata]|nr:hypothetical protein B0H14DRAFT_3491438 [Mycena olivaceomarginata]
MYVSPLLYETYTCSLHLPTISFSTFVPISNHIPGETLFFNARSLTSFFLPQFSLLQYLDANIASFLTTSDPGPGQCAAWVEQEKGAGGLCVRRPTTLWCYNCRTTPPPRSGARTTRAWPCAPAAPNSNTVHSNMSEFSSGLDPYAVPDALLFVSVDVAGTTQWVNKHHRMIVGSVSKPPLSAVNYASEAHEVPNDGIFLCFNYTMLTRLADEIEIKILDNFIQIDMGCDA